MVKFSNKNCKKLRQPNITLVLLNIYEPKLRISNNVVCATSKNSDQPAHMPLLVACIFYECKATG